MRNVWDRYDAQSQGPDPSSGSKVLTTLISALQRLVTEKPALLGVGTQMGGVGVSHNDGYAGYMSPSASSSGYGLDGMAGMVATAASATVSAVGGVAGVAGMVGGMIGGHSGAGLSLQGSTMKLQW